MKNTSFVKLKLLTRFDELIANGKAINEDITYEQKTEYDGSGYLFGLQQSKTYTYEHGWDTKRYFKWKVDCLTIFDLVVPRSGRLWDQVEQFYNSEENKDSLLACIGILESVRDNFELGMFDSLLIQVEAEVSADYLDQAERLLNDDVNGRYEHIPAAVLVGAVLEKNLRELCQRQQPPVEVIDSKGGLLTLNPLIDNIKKAGVITELKAKQLRAWTDIRNKAAHGHFEQFNRGDVEQMVTGVTKFLADYMK